MKKHLQPFLIFTKKYRLDIIIIFLFFLYSCAMTWPFVVQPNTTLVAPLVGDVSNSVTKFDSIRQERKNPLLDWQLDTIAAPEGITTNTGVDRVSFFSTISLWFATLATSSVIAHGLLTFFGYFLTALITYLFCKRVFKNRFIAALGGALYASFPLFISLARAAPTYIHMWLYILPLWAFYNLWVKFTKKRLTLAVLSILPAMFWTPYFTFHILLVGGAVLPVYLVHLWKSKGIKTSLKILLLFAVSWVLFVAIYYLIGRSSGQGGAPERTIQEIYDQSLHPLMLVLPGAFSWWGQAGYELLYNTIPRAFDTNLYAGVSVLLLAVFGTFSICYKKLRNILTPSIVIVGLFSIALFTITFLFALAPTISILGIDIPTPNALIAHVMPALRAGQRLVMPMMLAVIILAMIGLYALIHLIRNTRLRYIIAALIALILVIDLSSKPPLLTAQLPQSTVATQLAAMPDGLVVQYINGSITGDPSQVPCQLRLIHQKTIVNYCGLEINYPKGQLQPLHKLALLSFEQQLTSYEKIGVKYIIVEKTDSPTISEITNSNASITRAAEDNRFIIYQIDY